MVVRQLCHTTYSVSSADDDVLRFKYLDLLVLYVASIPITSGNLWNKSICSRVANDMHSSSLFSFQFCLTSPAFACASIISFSGSQGGTTFNLRLITSWNVRCLLNSCRANSLMSELGQLYRQSSFI